jgi:hypothetical protein
MQNPGRPRSVNRVFCLAVHEPPARNLAGDNREGGET